MHKLIINAFPPGGQQTAVNALQNRKSDASEHCLGQWNTEYGLLNRLISLWETSESINSMDIHTVAEDWLHPNSLERALHPRINIKKELLTFPFLELRMYAARPDCCEKFVSKMMAALHHREKYSPCAGIWTTRERGVDAVVHIWAYESLDQRMQARNAAMNDPDWSSYRASIRPLLSSLRAWLLTPAA